MGLWGDALLTVWRSGTPFVECLNEALGGVALDGRSASKVAAMLTTFSSASV